jgi:hypothetical protein
MKLNDIRETSRKIEHGAWVSNLPNLPGISVKVRGAFNSDYNRMLGKLRSELGPEEWKSDEVQDGIETTLLVETILIDWDGIEDAPYSKETAQQLLSDPDFAILKRAINFASSNVAREGRETLGEDAKN